MEQLSSLFNTDGIHFLLRFCHTFAAIIWIGHLYYINFVQGAFMGEADAATKSAAQTKLFPKVQWWFRYGALWTWILGVVLLLLRGGQLGADFMLSSYWVNILTGAWIATLMAANVWMVIWPAQRMLIASATQVAAGGQAIPEAAGKVAQAMVASRTNVLFSIPMLFFMGAASHWAYGANLASTGTAIYAAVAFILTLGLEYNALKGKTGPLTTVKGVITCGFILLFVFIVLIAALVRPVAV